MPGGLGALLRPPCKGVPGALLTPCPGWGSGSPGKRHPAAGRGSDVPTVTPQAGAKAGSQAKLGAKLHQPVCRMRGDAASPLPRTARAGTEPQQHPRSEGGEELGREPRGNQPCRGSGTRGESKEPMGRGLGAAGGAGAGTKELFAAAVNGSLTSDLSVWVLALCWVRWRPATVRAAARFQAEVQEPTILPPQTLATSFSS